MTTLRLVGSPWRTDTFRRLANRLENIVGSKTAKQFEPLKILSVGDLMRHLPRRYFSGTELSDLSALREGEEVAVMAEVVDARTFNLPDRPNYRLASKPRLEATITDHRGRPDLHVLRAAPIDQLLARSSCVPGARGIFAGKVTRFNGRLQLAHPDFVIVDEHGAVIGGAKHNASLASASRRSSCRPLSDGRQVAHLDDCGLRVRWRWILSKGSRIRCRRGCATQPR